MTSDRFWQRLGLIDVARDVSLGWTAMLVAAPLVAVFALGRYSGSTLPWLHSRFSLVWLVVFSLAVVGFSGAYIASEPGPPITDAGRSRLIRRLGGARLLAAAAGFFCVYLLSVVSWFVADAKTSRLAGELTWWGVPFSLCAWALAAVEIADETEEAGTGVPADPSRRWRWLAALRGSRTARRAAYVFQFGGAIGFAAAGSVPGLIWRRARPGEVASWNGHGYVTTPLYDFGVTVWAGILLIASMLFLAQAFHARPQGLPAAVLRRAWYSVLASAAVIVLMACFGLAAHGVLAEPIVDVAVAIYALLYAVMLVDASAVTRHRRVKSSIPRRVAAALATVGATFAIAIAVEPPFGYLRTAVLTLVVVALIPMFPLIHRSLYGINRRPRELDGVTEGADTDALILPPLIDASERNALYDALVGDQPAQAVSRDLLRHWQAALHELKTLELPAKRNAPTKRPLVYLLFTCDDGLERTKTYAPPEPLIVLLEKLFEGDLDQQKFTLIELMYRSARNLAGSNRDYYKGDGAPGAMEMLEAECVARLPGPPAGVRPERLRDMRCEWLFGKARIWTGASQPIERSQLQGNYHKRHGEIRADLLIVACDFVLDFWLERLAETISASASY